MGETNIKLYDKELKSKEIINFMKENYNKIREYDVSRENKQIFIWKPQNIKVKQRPIKDTRVVPGKWNPIKEEPKIVELTEEESRTLLFKGDKKENKETDKVKKTNLCSFIKADGNECKAKLKHGNCYCIRHMKMYAKRCELVKKL